MGELTRRSLFGVLAGAAAVAALPVNAAGHVESVDTNVPDDANDLLVRVYKNVATGSTFISARLFCYDGKLTHYHCDHPISEERSLSGTIPPEEISCPNGVPYPTRKYAVRYEIAEDLRDRLRRRRGDHTYRSFLNDLKAHATARVRLQHPRLLVPEGGEYLRESIPYELEKKYNLC